MYFAYVHFDICDQFVHQRFDQPGACKLSVGLKRVVFTAFGKEFSTSKFGLLYCLLTGMTSIRIPLKFRLYNQVNSIKYCNYRFRSYVTPWDSQFDPPNNTVHYCNG